MPVVARRWSNPAVLQSHLARQQAPLPPPASWRVRVRVVLRFRSRVAYLCEYVA